MTPPDQAEDPLVPDPVLHELHQLPVVDGDVGVRFHGGSKLQPHNWQELQCIVQRRVLRYFRRHGFLDEQATADMLTWQSTGGFSIDASVRIEGHDRHGLERLVR